MRTVAAVALVLLMNAAQAAPPTSESVEELLRIGRTESLIDSTYAALDKGIRETVRQAVGSRSLDAEQQRFLDELPVRLLAVMREDFSWATMKPHYVKLYQETFDQSEIDGMIAFYRTPAGQAVIEKLPIVLDKSLALSRERMKSWLPRLETALRQAIAEANIR